MTAVASAQAGSRFSSLRTRRRRRAIALNVFLSVMCALWLFPLLWCIYTALRPQAETIAKGYVSWPSALGIDNFTNAFNDGGFSQFYFNTLVITIPAVVATLIVASMVAFAISRYSWKFNILVLMIFTAGNLLPQQVLILPLFKLYNAITGIPAPLSDNGLLYDQYVGVFLINVVFQTGFCVFVLTNYMKTLPKELNEAAVVDGAGVLRTWAVIIMPLCRPAVAALATLEFTFIYNDFFWALFLMQTGSKRPITSALQNLQGQFFTNINELAAGAILAALPTIFVFMLLQRHFVSGLTLGSTKG